MSITLTKESPEQKTTQDYAELITVVIKYPNKPATVENIIKNNKTYEKIVEGYIAAVPFPGSERHMDLLMNDEGKMIHMEPNLYSPEYKNIFVGPLIAIGVAEKDLSWRSLTSAEIGVAIEYFRAYGINQSNIQKEE